MLSQADRGFECDVVCRREGRPVMRLRACAALESAPPNRSYGAGRTAKVLRRSRAAWTRRRRRAYAPVARKFGARPLGYGVAERKLRKFTGDSVLSEMGLSYRGHTRTAGRR